MCRHFKNSKPNKPVLVRTVNIMFGTDAAGIANTAQCKIIVYQITTAAVNATEMQTF